jgi:hypothetical protein
MTDDWDSVRALAADVSYEYRSATTVDPVSDQPEGRDDAAGERDETTEHFEGVGLAEVGVASSKDGLQPGLTLSSLGQKLVDFGRQLSGHAKSI